ncbi:MAG TPA: hypothetical protein VFI74_03445 [Candidatus Saccharimonadales bacterium]|nr:hypothetical protein [Candidatus Saccharimonadales bacterium]
MKRDPFSFGSLLLRSLLPSSTSIITGSLLAFIIVGAQLLTLSLNYGALLPQFFGGVEGYWVDTYAQYVLGPVQSFTTNGIVNTLILALFWGLIGWLIFWVVNTITSGWRDIRENQEAVTVLSATKVIYHPQRGMIVARIIWRILIVGAFIMSTFITLPFAHSLSVMVQEGFYAPALTRTITVLGLAYLGWMAILHFYVVLLRLYLFRTRVYGEIIG